MAETNIKTKYYCVDVKDDNGEYQPFGVFAVLDALKLPAQLGRACRMTPLGAH